MQYCVKNKIPRIIMPICDDTLFTLKLSSFLFDKFFPEDIEIDVLGFQKPDFNISKKMNFVSMDSEQVGGAKSWSKYILRHLEQIDDEEVLFTLEDFFPTKEPNTNILQEVLSLMKKNKSIGRFDLTYDSYCHGDSIKIGSMCNLDLMIKTKYSDYSVSTQPSIWNKKFLIDILSNTTSPWDFEINGTILSKKMKYEVLSFGDSTFKNFPTYWIHKGAVSRKCPGKINILGLDFDTIREMVGLGFFEESDLVWGMFSNIKSPSFLELGGYNFDPRKMPLHEASKTNWREYHNIYLQGEAK